MKNYIKIVLALLCLVAKAQGQDVNFVSPVVEKGVRQHLGISEDTAISFSQLDTITFLDLSRRGVTDIQDIKLMPNLRVIDLSDNAVKDLRPLAVLDSLEYVDLRYNSLKSINGLFFSTSKKMIVNVSFNNISDFSLFCSISSCDFTIDGTGLQQNEDAPYFDVYQLYADVSDTRVAKACYRGYTNMEADVTLKCGELSAHAVMDGYTNSVTLPYELGETTQVILTNGEVGDTTYVVPPKVYVVNAGDEVTINTALPESYQIGYLRTLHGTVEAEPKGDGSQGATLHYTAPSPLVADTLYMSYYEGNRIKGFAQMYFMSQDFYDGVKSLQQDNPMKMSLHDGVLSISGMSAHEKGITAVKVFDAMGRTLAMQTAKNQQSIEIPLPSSQTLVIVEVTYAGQRIVTKVAAR